MRIQLYIYFRKVISSIMLVTFTLSMTVRPAGAQLPPVGQMFALTPGFQPPILRGMTVYPENPLLFDFIVDRGQDKISDQPLKAESEKLIKYFLASMTIPDKDAWVNLSPFEKNRIVPEALGQTEMGKTMLEQDYMLKQLAASLTNPDTELGKEYWAKVGNGRDRSLQDLTKVWIIPAGATVVEKDGFAYITESKLDVMMEEDYKNRSLVPGSWSLERKQQPGTRNQPPGTLQQEPGTNHQEPSTAVFRSLILPKLIKEVNEGKTFAPTRQVYQSVILASWYKKALKDSLLGKIYADKSKIEGITTDEKDIKQKVYDQYLEAFKKGVYNVIKEEEMGEETVPRKYFSGGLLLKFGAGSSPLRIDGTSKGLAEAKFDIDREVGEGRDVLVAASAAESRDEGMAIRQAASSAVLSSPEDFARAVIQIKASKSFNRLMDILGFSGLGADQERQYIGDLAVIWHDLRTAQVAKVIADRLSLNAAKAELIGLVHDFAAVPFRHLSLAGSMGPLLTKLGVNEKQRIIDQLKEQGIDFDQATLRDLLNFDINKGDQLSPEGAVAIAAESVEGVFEDIFFSLKYGLFKYEEIPADILKLLKLDHIPLAELKAKIQLQNFGGLAVEKTVEILMANNPTPIELLARAKAIKHESRAKLLADKLFPKNIIGAQQITPILEEVFQRLRRQYDPQQHTNFSNADDYALDQLLRMSESEILQNRSGKSAAASAVSNFNRAAEDWKRTRALTLALILQDQGNWGDLKTGITVTPQNKEFMQYLDVVLEHIRDNSPMDPFKTADLFLTPKIYDKFKNFYELIINAYSFKKYSLLQKYRNSQIEVISKAFAVLTAEQKTVFLKQQNLSSPEELIARPAYEISVALGAQVDALIAFTRQHASSGVEENNITLEGISPVVLNLDQPKFVKAKLSAVPSAQASSVVLSPQNLENAGLPPDLRAEHLPRIGEVPGDYMIQLLWYGHETTDQARITIYPSHGIIYTGPDRDDAKQTLVGLNTVKDENADLWGWVTRIMNGTINIDRALRDKAAVPHAQITLDEINRIFGINHQNVFKTWLNTINAFEMVGAQGFRHYSEIPQLIDPATYPGDITDYWKRTLGSSYDLLGNELSGRVAVVVPLSVIINGVVVNGVILRDDGKIFSGNGFVFAPAQLQPLIVDVLNRSGNLNPALAQFKEKILLAWEAGRSPASSALESIDRVSGAVISEAQPGEQLKNPSKRKTFRALAGLGVQAAFGGLAFPFDQLSAQITVSPKARKLADQYILDVLDSNIVMGIDNSADTWNKVLKLESFKDSHAKETMKKKYAELLENRVLMNDFLTAYYNRILTAQRKTHKSANSMATLEMAVMDSLKSEERLEFFLSRSLARFTDSLIVFRRKPNFEQNKKALQEEILTLAEAVDKRLADLFAKMLDSAENRIVGRRAAEKYEFEKARDRVNDYLLGIGKGYFLNVSLSEDFGDQLTQVYIKSYKLEEYRNVVIGNTPLRVGILRGIDNINTASLEGGTYLNGRAFVFYDAIKNNLKKRRENIAHLPPILRAAVEELIEKEFKDLTEDIEIKMALSRDIHHESQHAFESKAGPEMYDDEESEARAFARELASFPWPNYSLAEWGSFFGSGDEYDIDGRKVFEYAVMKARAILAREGKTLPQELQNLKGLFLREYKPEIMAQTLRGLGKLDREVLSQIGKGFLKDNPIRRASTGAVVNMVLPRTSLIPLSDDTIAKLRNKAEALSNEIVLLEAKSKESSQSLSLVEMNAQRKKIGEKYQAQHLNRQVFKVNIDGHDIVIKVFLPHQSPSLEIDGMQRVLNEPLFQQYIDHGQSWIASAYKKGRSFVSLASQEDPLILNQASQDAELKKIIDSIPMAHWDQLIQIFKIARERQVHIDPSASNFLYDNESGFSVIDFYAVDIEEMSLYQRLKSGAVIAKIVGAIYTDTFFEGDIERKVQKIVTERLTALGITEINQNGSSAVGGIDFDPSKLNLQIKRDGHGVPLPLPQQDLEHIEIKGLFPVILNIRPVNAQTLPILGQIQTSSPSLAKS